MERTVPSTASEEIELFLRTVYSLLRSTTEVQIRTLEEVHAGMNSLLHPDARKPHPDMSAFIYSSLRLPVCISHVRSVVLGQSAAGFSLGGYGDVETWEQVSAQARRRRSFYNGTDILACYIASRTDIEDLVPTLTAYQIEWNKIHNLFHGLPADFSLASILDHRQAFEDLAEAMQISVEDLARLQTAWGERFISNLELIRERQCSFRLRLLGGSQSDYWRATRQWWDNIEHTCPAVLARPVYFVSSNMHSLSNLVSGFALRQVQRLYAYLERDADAEISRIWQDIRRGEIPASTENFLYFLLKEYQQTEEGRDLIESQAGQEFSSGIARIRSEHSFDVDAQVIDLSRLDPEALDPRLRINPHTQAKEDLSFLARSNALILNIDYPLGLAAYYILSMISEHAYPILGVYMMGKAATLNGVRGDVMIPNVVQDEQSQNTYLFQNIFTAADISPYLNYGTVLDNQKAVSVFGTFLQNSRFMDVFYREGFTDFEMETGSYLSAVYEMYRPKRHPVDEIVNLYGVPFDVGVLHYASDTPMSKGRNLGAGALSYYGLDCTYATSIAILRRIFSLERNRVASL
ncbi:MAG TPA: hypothetical protein VHO48_09645 [Anaerolineaceae bacterium]|nr:hypothetical protein [Anaerolineaceae bacterium]